ncbi:MAG: EI24 domain-containing protein [Planctomycetaceae bacterium]|nr:EI24 domain-containing protein [Planctomycetaceae bacterium]
MKLRLRLFVIVSILSIALLMAWWGYHLFGSIVVSFIYAFVSGGVLTFTTKAWRTPGNWPGLSRFLWSVLALVAFSILFFPGQLDQEAALAIKRQAALRKIDAILASDTRFQSIEYTTLSVKFYWVQFEGAIESEADLKELQHRIREEVPTEAAIRTTWSISNQSTGEIMENHYLWLLNESEDEKHDNQRAQNKSQPAISNEPADVYTGLRDLIFQTDFQITQPKIIGAQIHLHAVLMEFTSGKEFVTLVAMQDGTTSLYFSSGGGVIGAGEHAPVRAANQQFLGLATQYIDQ